MTLLAIPPFLIFLVGAIAAGLAPSRFVALVVILTSVAAGALGYFAPDGVYASSVFLKYSLELAVGTNWSNIAQLGLALSILLIGIASKRSPDARAHVLGLSAAAFASGAISAGDLVSMYLFLELLVVTLVLLIALGRQPRSQWAAIHFMVIQLLASIVFKLGMSDFHHEFQTYSLSAINRPISELQFGWALLFGVMVKLSAWPLAYLIPMGIKGSSLVGRLYIASSLPFAGLVCLHWLTGSSHSEQPFILAAGGLMVGYALIYSFARWVVGLTGIALVALTSPNTLLVNMAIGLLPIASVLLLSALPMHNAAPLDQGNVTTSSGVLLQRDTDRVLEFLVNRLVTPIFELAQSLWSELISQLNASLASILKAARAFAGERGLLGQVWGIGPTSLWVIALLGLYGVIYLVF
jgi:hypothetical protein